LVGGRDKGRRGWRAAFWALGEQSLPANIELPSGSLTHVRTFKHDFFAATGLYRDAGGREVVVKMYRWRGFFGLPLGWLGRWMAAREARIYQALSDVAGVPRFEGRPNRFALAHEFIPGQPLQRSDRVSDQFFDQLAAMLRAIHQRKIAYVDLNKPQNILLGRDGRPYLIDFQISWQVRAGSPTNTVIGRGILRLLQKEDWYHLLKHKRRMRPDLLTDQERMRACRKSVWIRLHRLLSQPYFAIRRWLMKKLALPRAE